LNLEILINNLFVICKVSRPETFETETRPETFETETRKNGSQDSSREWGCLEIPSPEITSQLWNITWPHCGSANNKGICASKIEWHICSSYSFTFY